MRRVAYAVVLGCLVCHVVGFGSGAGSAPPGIGAGLFSQRGLDAYAMSLGEALVAVARGSATSYYNPAGLSSVEGLQVGGLYCAPYGREFGVSHQYFSVSGPLGVQTASRNGIGVGITWIGSTIGDIALWDDQGYAGVTEASSSIWMASFGTAIPALDDLCVGASVKYHTARLLEGRGAGVGFDLSLLKSFDLGDGTRIAVGLNSMDVGQTHIRWESVSGTTDNVIPWTHKFGLAVEALDRRLLLACGVDLEAGGSLSELALHFGAEIRVVDALALRAGWTGKPGAGGSFAAGAAVRVDRLTLDYAYVPGKVFGDTHIFSAAITF
jgi:hypothetical protein